MFQKYILTPTWCFVSEKMKDMFKVSHAQVKDMATCIHMYMCMYMTPVSDAHYATIHSGLDTA